MCIDDVRHRGLLVFFAPPLQARTRWPVTALTCSPGYETIVSSSRVNLHYLMRCMPKDRACTMIANTGPYSRVYACGRRGDCAAVEAEVGCGACMTVAAAYSTSVQTQAMSCGMALTCKHTWMSKEVGHVVQRSSREFTRTVTSRTRILTC